MPKTQPFIIYNASAGSGKTYTLVKAYLKLLFQTDNLFYFNRILAITFTNKAVSEMKERLIETLKTFSKPDILTSPDSMFEAISIELNLAPNKLRERSETLLQTIIHNYAAFDISTIDGFTHKLIRTFAHDLKLPLNFEVEIDQESLLTEAVDSLLSKAGTNPQLTKTLVDFAIEKADDDKSFDLSFDFNKIAKLLVNENDISYIEALKDKSLQDFAQLKQQIGSEISETETIIITEAKNILNTISQSGLEDVHFSRKTLPNHFKKLTQLEFKNIYSNKLEENISERKNIYNKTLAPDLAQTIEALLPQIEQTFKAIKANVYHHKFLKLFYKNITPLSVLNAIDKELRFLKSDQNKMLISEFNTIISNEIKGQPTPFIYERIGEKFKHYFIDEFQDTSIMQWKNLVPLLGNALASEGGTSMLVGDAKQAIYRWRGGKAEQFIGLCHADNPFHTKKSVEHLPANYRSFNEIVTFNNQFFTFLAQYAFSQESYQAVYENASQNQIQDKQGYVELSFLEIDKDQKRDDIFPQTVLEKINFCLEQGFDFENICVLVRKRKEGVAVANYLSQNNIPIISSETLLISSAPEVAFINHVLELLIQPKNNQIKIEVLDFLAHTFNLNDKHSFFNKHINQSLSEIFNDLESYGITISHENLLQLPLYDLVETLVRSFGLTQQSNAYIQFYLDLILDFSQKKGSDIASFLDYFNKKKDSLSIISPKGQNAVQIMTIHKSKGLEFPVVIFPYADLDIYAEVDPKAWFKLDNTKYGSLQYTLLNYTNDFEYFGEEGYRIFNKHRAEQELDSINLLYVALTRAEEQLYIISSKDISAKGEVNTKRYSGLLISYLQHNSIWNNYEFTYAFGKPIKESTPSKPKHKTKTQEEFISVSKNYHNIKVVTTSGYLWDTRQEKAIEKGNLLHTIMSHIITKNDIESVISRFIDEGKINKAQATLLKAVVDKIVNHEKLQKYFSDAYTIYNEQDIITKQGLILRPDRIAINSKGQAVIIDYKTGLEDKTHAQQLQSYQDALQSMKISTKKKILVYLNEDIKIKDV
ncbi:UvrD-helicase domain-containing protein [Tamlana fucoidanivorans]|uniref:DNA 3'-5' helicase n=1 Tax=Allotamlana fucoidanivorans TaxID=2583814 RepID=A0A5C4SSC5_9FLAO|nr:UvrD-helicase domain-containing protein [Tamlana fucoidanivorans]TNJ47175.1 DNA helicase UvrD [Tamlana fucoidanivorans]